MRIRDAFALSLLALGACAPATEEPVGESTAAQRSPSATTAATATPSPSEPLPQTPPVNALAAGELPGEYRIAGVDGGDINLPHAITASIRQGRIRVVAGCVNALWEYTYAAGRLATKREPVVTCQRGLYPEEEAVFAAIDAAERATRTPANGIELSGGGHSVTLFSQ